MVWWNDPAFYDIFGFVGFLFITLLALWSLKKKHRVPRWAKIILLIVGVIGLVVDGYVVLSRFLVN